MNFLDELDPPDPVSDVAEILVKSTSLEKWRSSDVHCTRRQISRGVRAGVIR